MTSLDAELIQLTEDATIHEAQSPTIEGLRSVVDGCDLVIIEAIAARNVAVQQLGELKLSEGLPVRDISRENSILRSLRERALEHGVDPSIVTRIWGDVLFHDARLSQERRRQLGRPALIDTKDTED